MSASVPVLGVAASVLIGVSLGFFGGGGSILTVPLFVYVFGLDAKVAIASSLIVVGVASTAAMIQHWRAGNVELRTGVVFGAAGMCGAYLGGRAAQFVDGALLLLLFASMMALTALAMWRGRRAPTRVAHCALAPLVAQGLAVGLFTGLIGAGGGFLIVPALAIWAGLPMPAAVGTSLLVIVMNSAAGFAGYAAHVAVAPGLVAAVSACAIAGSVAGAAFARRTDPARLRRAFAGFVLVMAGVILAREADAWVRSARAALPQSLPQLVFAAFVLGAGIAAGRASRGSGSDLLLERGFEEGAGI
jgi:uncharacterized membrane protein YfcA